MADGTVKPIEKVKVGDEVTATDPTTGRTDRRKVTREIVGSGDKALVEVRIDVDGPSGARTATITATDGHPFWVDDPGSWTDAGSLQPGDLLLAPDGSRVRVVAVAAYHARATVHNLTVDDLHTYYVVAGDQALLVHNCGDTAKHDVDELADSLDDNVVFHYTSEVGHEGIMNGSVITASPKGVTYFTREMLGPGETSNALFMGRGGDRGTHLIAFRVPAGTELAPGSQPNELAHTGSFRFTLDDVVFHGPNPF
jgi:hypothetical protein